MIRRAAAALLLAVVTPSAASAQQWRTVEVSRQLHDTAAHRVRINYSGGRLEVRPAAVDSRSFFEMFLRYDQQRVRPMHHLAVDSRTLTLGTDREGSLPVGRHMDGYMTLELSRRLPLDVSLQVGAVDAQLDLGGLALTSLSVKAGASEARIHFASPNPMSMRLLSLEAGAASLHAFQLANANAATVRVSAGVGSVELDFSGVWTQDIVLDASFAVGAVQLRVPSDVGVHITTGRVLATIRHDGLVRGADGYYSPNWDSARHRLHVRGGTTLGRLSIDRSGP